ncbi:phasin family protein, partial [Klebsiella pneumoniae]|nr:phasin family protein [Klebsiella pneumoniae]
LNNQFAELNQSAVDAAARLSKVSIDSAERMFALQLAFAKAALAVGGKKPAPPRPASLAAETLTDLATEPQPVAAAPGRSRQILLMGVAAGVLLAGAAGLVSFLLLS